MADLARKLKELRESRRLTLEQAAKLAGFRNFQTLSKIEHGSRQIKAEELVTLAKAYSFDINFFLLDEPKPSEVQIFWRAELKPSNPQIVEAKLQMYFDRYLHLQEILGYTKMGHRLFEINQPIENAANAAEYGERYACDLKLGDRPGITLPTILEEEWNLPIFYFELPDGTSAGSIISKNNAAIAVNSLDAPWRRKFDIAHEVFHIIHKQSAPEECGASNDSAQETFANAFASALLLPRGPLEIELERRKKKGQIQITDLMILAREFGVSLDALIWRLVNFGRITRNKAQTVLSSPAVREYNKSVKRDERWETPHISRKYLSMVFEAVNQGLMSKMRAAEYLDVSISKLEAVFLSAGLALKEESDIEVTIM